MSRFASRFKKALLATGVIFCSYWGFFGTFAKDEPVSSKGGYLIFAKEETAEKDVRWARYLYDHLKNRAENEDAVEYGTSDNDLFRISVRLDTALKKDFQIKRHRSALDIIARDDEKMLWLQYQVMKKIADEDMGIAAADLPPAIVNLRDTCGSFCFGYRGIYSPASRDSDYAAIIGTDNLDNGWGLWGHNLYRAIGKEAPPSVYATVNGEKSRAQYCFSSGETYRLIEKYILSDFGHGERGSVRFLIAPNDNPLACTCADCIAAGNTPGNATPAVTKLIARLAGCFPRHLFFTTSYLSTKEAPAERMPDNSGVVVSAMDLPLRSDVRQGSRYRDFTTLLENWKGVTENVYIWDYINNFDDYLTPFPILKIMQERLRFFRDRQVNGVFLNGSGYDYSSFDGMKTYVLSALLINPDLPVNELAGAYLEQYFPSSARKIVPFYCAMENRAEKCRRPLNLYGGIADAEHTFLDIPEFVRFYDELEGMMRAAGAGERKMLNELLTALTFTRLEIARAAAFDAYGCAEREGNRITIKREVAGWLARLDHYKEFPAMLRYRETGGEIDNYIAEWRSRILENGRNENLLLGEPLIFLSAPDEGYEDLSVLADGIPGLPGNYHCGWILVSQSDPEIGLPGDAARNARTFSISFLHDPGHRIRVPDRVELYKNGALYKILPVTPVKDEKPRAVSVTGSVDLEDARHLSVTVRRKEGEGSVVAIDEIQLIR